jgi:uncharacterized protein (TIGR02246 family)
VAWAAEPNAAKPQDPIRASITAIEKCFNSGDAKGLAELWKPDGCFTGPQGECIAGRKNIEAAFQTFFAAHKNSKLRLAVVDMRPITNDVAVVDAIADMTPAPEGVEGEPRSTILLVLRDGRWLIDSIRETVGAAPSHFGRLKELGWMVGDWTGTVAGSSDATMHSTCDWTAKGSYLIRKFSISGKNGHALSGTEVIGWDPRAHRICSWIFESDGGFGQSEWTRDGDHWTVKYNGVLADGGDISATHVLTLVDANTLKLQSTARLVNGEKRPDVAEITIKRRPAKDSSKAETTKPPKQLLP